MVSNDDTAYIYLFIITGQAIFVLRDKHINFVVALHKTSSV